MFGYTPIICDILLHICNEKSNALSRSKSRVFPCFSALSPVSHLVFRWLPSCFALRSEHRRAAAGGDNLPTHRGEVVIFYYFLCSPSPSVSDPASQDPTKLPMWRPFD